MQGFDLGFEKEEPEIDLGKVVTVAEECRQIAIGFLTRLCSNDEPGEGFTALHLTNVFVEVTDKAFKKARSEGNAFEILAGVAAFSRLFHKELVKVAGNATRQASWFFSEGGKVSHS